MIKHNELVLPFIGLGTLRLCGEDCVSIIKKALDLGYRHIDTAPMYHNHQDIRQGIANFDRQKLIITSKYLPEQGNLEKACDLALNELGLDYLDLYLIHWPDRSQPMAEILRNMEKLKSQGKIREFGVSNYTIRHLRDMIELGINIPYNQVEFHPYLYQKNLLDFCFNHRIQLIAYRPLGRGEMLSDPLLQQMGERYSKTAAQVILRWLVQKNIHIVVKTNSKEHLEENLTIFDFVLRDEDMFILDQLNCNKRFCITRWADFEY